LSSAQACGNLPTRTKQSENIFLKIRIYINEPAILVLAVKKGPPLLVGLFIFRHTFFATEEDWDGSFMSPINHNTAFPPAPILAYCNLQ
jgi:hypothetical protein